MSTPTEKFIEWVDALPPTWGAKRLGTLASVKARLGWKGLKAEEYVDEGYIFLATPNLKGDEIDFENVNYITKARYEESPEIMLREGDVLMVKDGATLGIVALVKSLPAPATVNGSTAVIRSTDKCDSRFLCHWLRSRGVQQLIEKMKGGMGVPHVFQSDLRRFPVALPLLPEQHRIAVYLDEQTAKIDRLMEMRRRQMALLKEQRAALIQQAVIRGLNPNAPMKDSGLPWLGEIPKHWEVKRLKYICKVTTGSKDTVNAEEDGAYPFFVRSQIVERIGSFAFDGEAVLTAGDGAGVGKVFHHYEGKFDFHQRVYMLYDFKEILGRFVFHYLKENFYKVALEGGAKSTVDSLRMPVFLNFCMIMPPIDEQKEILEAIKTAGVKNDDLLSAYARQLTLLAEYRAALIHECVTGQRTVSQRTVVEAAPAKPNIPFLRAVLCSEIVHRLHQEPTFGRVKLEKFLYLSEAYAGIDLEGKYQRAAAGPFDNQALRSAESQIQKQKWYQPVKGKKGTRYLPMEKAGGHQKYFSRYWPEQQPKFDRLFNLLRSFATERCEIVATLFAVWHDRLRAEQPCTDADIVDEVLTKWHPSKQRIPRDRWLSALKWMKQEGLTP